MEAKDLALSQIVSRTTLRIARRISASSDVENLARLNAALIILNQAQILVGRDNKMAKRMVDKAREIK